MRQVIICIYLCMWWPSHSVKYAPWFDYIKTNFGCLFYEDQNDIDNFYCHSFSSSLISLMILETLLKSLSRPRASSILVLKFRAVQGCFTWNAYGLLLWLYAPCFRMEHFLYPLSMPMCVHTVAHIAPTVIQNQQYIGPDPRSVSPIPKWRMCTGIYILSS